MNLVTFYCLLFLTCLWLTESAGRYPGLTFADRLVAAGLASAIGTTVIGIIWF